MNNEQWQGEGETFMPGSEQNQGETEKNQPQGLVLTRDAGRALDALIAVKVMGWVSASERQMWSLGDDNGPGEPDGTAWMGQLPPDQRTHPEQHIHLPYYSTDIAAAWLVVEKLHARRIFVTVYGDTAGMWHSTLGTFDICDADTAPLAICRAALAAMEAS